MKRDAPRQRSGRCCWGIKIQESRHEKSVTSEISCKIIQGNGNVMRRYVDLDVSEHTKIKLSYITSRSLRFFVKLQARNAFSLEKNDVLKGVIYIMLSSKLGDCVDHPRGYTSTASQRKSRLLNRDKSGQSKPGSCGSIEILILN